MTDPYVAKTAALLQQDAWRWRCLQAVRDLHLPDGYIAAGFLRNAIWDAVHQQPTTALNDIDVVFFEPNDTSLEREQALEAQLSLAIAGARFEVRNQARMHIKHQHAPYQSAADGIRRWVEQATCVGVRLRDDDQLEFVAPFGLALNWSLHVTLNPEFPQPALFCQRIRDKKWLTHWPLLHVQWPESAVKNE